jgi:hypothetical protein
MKPSYQKLLMITTHNFPHLLRRENEVDLSSDSFDSSCDALSGMGLSQLTEADKRHENSFTAEGSCLQVLVNRLPTDLQIGSDLSLFLARCNPRFHLCYLVIGNLSLASLPLVPPCRLLDCDPL